MTRERGMTPYLGRGKGQHRRRAERGGKRAFRRKSRKIMDKEDGKKKNHPVWIKEA